MGEDRVALSVHYENYAFLRLGNVTNLEKPALLVVPLIYFNKNNVVYQNWFQCGFEFGFSFYLNAYPDPRSQTYAHPFGWILVRL